jgi:hypothetical protein
MKSWRSCYDCSVLKPCASLCDCRPNGPKNPNRQRQSHYQWSWRWARRISQSGEHWFSGNRAGRWIIIKSSSVDVILQLTPSYSLCLNSVLFLSSNFILDFLNNCFSRGFTTKILKKIIFYTHPEYMASVWWKFSLIHRNSITRSIWSSNFFVI